MNIIGTAVSHKSWGKGMIADLKNNVVYIKFDFISETTPFQFPQAFTNGFLTPFDSHDALVINSYIQSLKCNNCGKMNIATELIDENYYCSVCKTKHTMPCSLCKKSHISSNLTQIGGIHKNTHLCTECVETHSYVCAICSHRFLFANKNSKELNETIVCEDCYNEAIKVCCICGNSFPRDNGKHIYQNLKSFFVCCECSETSTFGCSKCGKQRLNDHLIESKFVPTSRLICKDCVVVCSVCSVEIDKENTYAVSGQRFCPDCWSISKKECDFCGEDFIPKGIDQNHCSDCVEMLSYVDRLKKIPHIHKLYKTIDCFSLDNIDRCSLFTQLYENCINLEFNLLPDIVDSQFSFIVMKTLGYNVVVTHLPRNVVGKVRYACNITMTELRSKKGRSDVYSAINDWIDLLDDQIETSAGMMKILNYPLLLRVQTEHDKTYGKAWDGPYGYTVLGNYGDTTDFHIVGIL